MGEACPDAENLTASCAPGEPVSILSWFALRVRSRAEASTAAALERKAIETFSPQWRSRPAFGGYLFARFVMRDRSRVLGTPGVSSVLSTDGRPAPVSEAEIDAVRRALEHGAAPASLPELLIGQAVRVIAGPLAGVEGVLQSRSGNRLVVTVPLLRRAVAVKIDPESVRPL